MGLVTEFVKVAQSGPTIDGRIIDANQLREMANNYDKDIYTASVFPNHDRSSWSNSYGFVDAIEAREEDNGIVGLYAKISPNAFWQSDIRFGQKAFTSIEITPNFAQTGEAYLTGLGATNNPAALGVEQLKFSQNGKLYSQQLTAVFTEDKPKSYFFSLFKRQEPDMKPEQATVFQAQLDALAQKVSLYEAQQLTSDVIINNDNEKYAALEKELADLKAENATLKADAVKQSSDYSALKTDLETFAAQLKDALKEQPGTSSKESQPDNLNAYI